MTTKKIAVYAVLTGLVAAFHSNFSQAASPIEHWTQPSGAQVFLVPSPGIPMLDIRIDFDAGTRRDHRDQAGLAAVTAGMIDKGVSAGSVGAALDENALGQAWADLGAGFSVHASADRMSFSLRTLTYPDLLSKAVQLAARELGEPAFSELVWKRERERLGAAIREANTRPATRAGRAFAAAVYGQHPYGFEMTEATLAAISVDDMKASYATWILPCRAKVTMVGAVNRAQAESLVHELFSRLSAHAAASGVGCPSLPAVAEVAPLTQASEQRIAFDSAQAHILIGQPGFKRDDPDYFALTVGNYILGGGGLVSRLSDEVRERRGLSYSVHSDFGPGLHAGAFVVSLQTRPDQADEALRLVRRVVADFVVHGPTESELQAAKDYLVGGFALRIDSNRKLLENVASLAWNSLALNYLDEWSGQVQKVTQADIRAAFARKLQPDRMVTVVLGARP